MAEDKILQKLGEHEVRLDRIERNMVTKDDLATLRDDILNSHDAQITILIRLDQERIFTNETIKRLQKKLTILNKFSR